MKIRLNCSIVVASLLALIFLMACPKQHKEPQDLAPDRLTGREILFEGLITEGAIEEFHYLQPGVFLDVIDFPIVPERGRPFNPIGLSDDVLDILRRIRPEIRLWGTDLGVAVERRGWQQFTVVRCPNCVILFDFRADVRDVSLGRNGPFGRVPGTQWWVVVLNRSQHNSDGLYILVVTQVQINGDRIGQPFTENHNGVRKAWEDAGKPVTIPAMPRWFIVEHELGHVDQIGTWNARLDTRPLTTGEYFLRVTMETFDGQTGSSMPVTIRVNKVPFVSATASPEDEQGSVLFDATGSEDPDGLISSWTWDFGDGSTGSGSIVEHVYADLSRTYEVSLTVVDNLLATSTEFFLLSFPEFIPLLLMAYEEPYTYKKRPDERIIWWDGPSFDVLAPPVVPRAQPYPNGTTYKADFIALVRGTDDKYCYVAFTLDLERKAGKDKEELKETDSKVGVDSVLGLP